MTHPTIPPTSQAVSSGIPLSQVTCKRHHTLDNATVCVAYRLFYFLHGAGQCYVEKEQFFSLCDQDILLCPPNQQLSFIPAQDQSCDYVLVTFPADSLLSSDGKMTLPTSLWHMHKATPDMVACLDKLQTLSTLSTAERVLLTRLTLTELCLYIHLQNEAHIESEANVPLASKVMQYVNEHLTSPLSLDEIAKHFFVSKYYLCRSFKSVYGTSLHHFWNRRRVELACRLISEGKTASAAAYHVGFGDYSTFYRAYKKHLGHAPTASAES